MEYHSSKYYVKIYQDLKANTFEFDTYNKAIEFKEFMQQAKEKNLVPDVIIFTGKDMIRQQMFR